MAPVALDEEEVGALAVALLDLIIPSECLPGVVVNLTLLAEHARNVVPDRG